MSAAPEVNDTIGAATENEIIMEGVVTDGADPVGVAVVPCEGFDRSANIPDLHLAVLTAAGKNVAEVDRGRKTRCT